MIKCCKDCEHYQARFIEHCAKTITQRWFDASVGKSRYDQIYVSGTSFKTNKNNDCEYYRQTTTSKVIQYISKLFGK